MKKKYDIIIIGSGMGGLVSSIILAKEGYKVAVLEKNNQYGGNLQTFSRDKAIFDTGVHYIGSLSEGQNLNEYFKYLGIREELKAIKMDEKGFDIITFEGEDKQYPYAQGYEGFYRELSLIFPQEKKAIREYCSKIQAICQDFPLYQLRPGINYNKEVLTLSVKAFLDEITSNEKLKSVLAGTNILYAGIDDKTPLYVHALSVNSYIKSAYRILRGGSQITKLLIKQLRKFGGDIFKKTEITSYLFEGDTPIGVQSKDKRIFYGDKFISNVEISRTIQLVGEKRFRKSFISRIQSLSTTPSSFTVYIKFKPQSFPYFNHNIHHFKCKESVWNAAKCKDKDWPTAYMISQGIDVENQKYADNMSILTYMDFQKVKKWEATVNTIVNKGERGEEYQEFKQKHIQIILDKLEKKFPNIRSCIAATYASTPLSYRDYIGGKDGNIYGYEKNVAAPLQTFVSPKTKIPNLYLTGQSVSMHGILGTTIGAISTCSEILGQEYLLHQIKKELDEKVEQ